MARLELERAMQAAGRTSPVGALEEDRVLRSVEEAVRNRRLAGSRDFGQPA